MGTGSARSQQLPGAPERPPALDSGVVPGRVDVVRGGWSGELVSSARLNGCRVVLRDVAGRRVRTIGCEWRYLEEGDVLFHRDGRTASGHPAPAGRCAWQLVGGNGSGAVQPVAGSPARLVGGSLEVSH
jgi:hypothetical protein